MRKLVYAINLTLDGCFDHTSIVAGEDVMDYYIQLVGSAGLLVYGRKTYELMVPYWPDIAKDPSGHSRADIEYAKVFDAVGTVVFSRSLDKVEGKDRRIVRSDLKDEMLRLKQEKGKDILTGGVDIPSQLMALGLIDEYRFVVSPVVVGKGRRLLDGIDMRERLRLKLLETRIFKSGCVLLHYVKQ